jgi:hypothetical protein
MDYLKAYYKLVESRKGLKRDIYIEKHHIVPKGVFGKSILPEKHLAHFNDSLNIVELSAREHFVGHWLLHRAFPSIRNLAAAFHAMASMVSNSHKRYTPSSRAIEEARIANADSQKLPVAMYNLDGELLRVFRTTEEAAKLVNSSVHNISAACTEGNQVNNIKGFQWRRFDVKPSDKISPFVNQNNIHSIKVHEYSLQGCYRRSYSSIREAASFGVDRSSLKTLLRNKPIHSKDHWYIVSSNAPAAKIDVKKRATQRRQVLQIDPKSGKIIRIWNSTREPQSELGISNVSAVCKGTRKTMGGYIWKYAEEDFELDLSKHERKLSKANEIEVLENNKSLGVFPSLRRAELTLGIGRYELKKSLNSGITNKNGIAVIYKDKTP